ncbi:FAD-dependent oxidoreductase [Acidisoma cellulosilytica]|uniref:FAD-dependent oxidoreductase n=1 Tax=Acidisoma cellulosilyticum TaxID=2802395 RepID=A0A963Z5W1_9PROT|nr:NAD(P)/FAD-dependent oxidoreductase [Acidisoma cellulosilyticum]MCB8883116.1 FAD-dependent oxidoreductase [Acidisoma cellulosilyticum]
MSFRPDPKSIAGTNLPVAERAEVLVIGGGPAGMAAAMQAASEGRSVILVDENPIGLETMAENLPLHFGSGMTGAVRNRNAMLEAVAGAMPALEDCLAAGVDVRLGTACWGIYAPGPDIGWLAGPVAGLMDGARSWMIGAERIVVAAGQRDMGLAFPGWEKDGVMGILAAERLAVFYGALQPRRLVVLGTGTETLQSALALQAAGATILAVVEVGQAPLGAPAMLTALAAKGTRLISGHAPKQAEGGAAVEALVLRPVDDDGHGQGGADIRIACDGVLLGVGQVPVVELLDAAGCRMVFDPARGGIVPELDARQGTSKPGIYAAGNCAGIWPAKTLDTAIARGEGQRAASALPGAAGEHSPPDGQVGEDRLAWVRATVLDAGDSLHVCQCEEVTAREILELRPPRYLGVDQLADGLPQSNRRDLRSLLGDHPHPDQVKRLTRAGMGPCQGRRCREQVAALLALASDLPYGAIRPASHRAPVRPMPLRLAALTNVETDAMARHWDTWFGMPAQYVPFWSVPARYTAATRSGDTEGASE